MSTPNILQLNLRTVWVPLSGGFWGMIDEKGGKWRAAQMPAELQKADLQLEMTAMLAPQSISIFMWGKEIDIIAYQIQPQ